MFNWIKNQFITYTTPRLVAIRSPIIATLFLTFFVTVFFAVLGSLGFDLRGLYQKKCPVRGVVLTQVRGYASTEELSDEDLEVDYPEHYKRVWDPSDLVFPPQVGEGFTGSFLLVTNLIITPNQTLTTCSEETSLSSCNGDGECQQGFWSTNSSGIYTGKCLEETNACEIRGWCPAERRVKPRRGTLPLLEDVRDFTVMLKNTVVFPDCGDISANNLQKSYMKNCTYDKQTNPDCPVFKVGDLLKWAREDFTKAAIRGAVIKIKIGESE